MTALAAATRTPAAGHRPAQFRFGAVFALVLALVLFEVLAPSDDWARAVIVALAGGALTVAVATSRARAPVGAKLYISLNTVKTHSRELYRKLGAASRADAV